MNAKYWFKFWPALHGDPAAGATATNARNRIDWLPLLWTPPGKPLTFLIPPIPDYPSAAADAGGGCRSADGPPRRSRGLRDHQRRAAWGARRFKNFSHAARESGMSRVYGGIHFLHAVEDGLAQGKSIGRAVAAGRSPPVRR